MNNIFFPSYDQETVAYRVRYGACYLKICKTAYIIARPYCEIVNFAIDLKKSRDYCNNLPLSVQG